jgi:hypothetical protein
MSETQEQKKSRIAEALKIRDEAMQRAREYQKKTGMPTKEEIDADFFKNIKIN